MNVPFKKQLNYLLLLGIMLFSTAALFAQGGSVKGTVTDANGDPIIGATVSIEGTTKGTVSDVSGNFSILNLPEGSVTLVVNFVGFLKETQMVSVTSNVTTEINFILIEDLQQLSEVVVIGYGSVKKSDLVGSVASVSVQDMQKLPSANVDNMLQGMAAGVMVLQNSGQPGSQSSIRIRGLATVNGGTPLVVIDGISGGSLNDLNPSDIESIEILKDAASQSIYGSAGGNGVILVTTKKGKEGKLKVKFDMFTGIQTAWNKDINIADAQEYASLYNTYMESLERNTYFPQDASGTYLDPISNEPLVNTHWTDEIFRPALIQNYNLSLSAGNKVSKIFMGLNYSNENGTLKKTSSDRYTIRLNSELKILKRFTIGENFNIAQTYNATQGERNEYGSPLSTSIQMLPIVPIYATDGSGNFAYKGAGLSSNAINPLAQIEYNNNINKVPVINGNAFIRAEIIKGLTYESNFGVRYTSSEFRNFTPEYVIGNVDDASASQSQAPGQYTFNYSKTQSWQWQNFVNYNFTLAKIHNFNITAGYESGYYKNDFTNRQDAVDSDTTDLTVSNWKEYSQTDFLRIAQQRMIVSTGYAEFARLNYDINGIFLLQANIRRDHSSKFGPNARVGTFPSISAGLKFSEFQAVKNLNIIDFGKVRIGYGETGNSDIPPFQYLSSVAPVNVAGSPFDGITVTPGAELITAGNPDLAWETVVTENIGLDLAFLRNRISLSVDLFSRQNQDMLLRRSIVGYAGYTVTNAQVELGDPNIDTRPLVNYGTLDNRGFEITASYKDRMGEFGYDFNATFTRAITTIDDIGDPLYGGTGRNLSQITWTTNGGPVSAFYGYRTNGIYQEEDFTWYKNSAGRWRRVAVDPNGAIVVEGFDINGNPVSYNTSNETASPGNYKYVDANGDGEITSADLVQIGDPNPDFIYSFGADLTYKNFDLNLFFQGSYGNDIFNMVKVFTHTMNNGGVNVSNDLYDSYFPAIYDASNPDALPTLITPANNTNTGAIRMDGNMAASDRYVEDGSYLRLKNLQLGYTFPADKLERLKIKNLRIYFSTKNLLTFTKYSGFDPEVNETSILEKGFDRGTYPQSKSYVFGLNLAF
jgi:TonB-dependent starch-binding outer membrane protein SusC